MLTANGVSEWLSCVDCAIIDARIQVHSTMSQPELECSSVLWTWAQCFVLNKYLICRFNVAIYLLAGKKKPMFY